MYKLVIEERSEYFSYFSYRARIIAVHHPREEEEIKGNGLHENQIIMIEQRPASREIIVKSNSETPSSSQSDSKFSSNLSSQSEAVLNRNGNAPNPARELTERMAAILAENEKRMKESREEALKKMEEERVARNIKMEKDQKEMQARMDDIKKKLESIRSGAKPEDETSMGSAILSKVIKQEEEKKTKIPKGDSYADRSIEENIESHKMSNNGSKKRSIQDGKEIKITNNFLKDGNEEENDIEVFSDRHEEKSEIKIKEGSENVGSEPEDKEREPSLFKTIKQNTMVIEDDPVE